MASLDKIDLTPRLDRDDYEKRLLAAQRRFLQLRLTLGGHLGNPRLGPGVLVIM